MLPRATTELEGSNRQSQVFVSSSCVFAVAGSRRAKAYFQIE